MDEIFLPKPEKRARLRQLLEDHRSERGFQRRLARYCEVDPRTIFNWAQDDGTWPNEATERKLWEYFKKLEAGQTGVLQEGMTLRLSLAAGVTIPADTEIILKFVRHLMTQDPETPVDAHTLSEVQVALRRIVKILAGFAAAPGGEEGGHNTRAAAMSSERGFDIAPKNTNRN